MTHLDFSQCPCGSPHSYDNCCAPLHQRRSRAQSAEQLMRSRFTAFYLGETEYLLATLHPQQRSHNELKLINESLKHQQWLSLHIIESSQYLVEFVAFYKAQPFAQLHERSRFCFEEGDWYYIDGEQLAATKLRRNQNCPCGSKRKYKQCCAS